MWHVPGWAGSHGKGKLRDVQRGKTKNMSRRPTGKPGSREKHDRLCPPKAEALQEQRTNAGGKSVAKWEGRKDNEGTVTPQRRGSELGVLVGLAEPLVPHQGSPSAGVTPPPPRETAAGPGESDDNSAFRDHDPPRSL